MRLYYMTSLEIATKYILPERRMKLSLIPDLNDPFELQPYVLSQPELRKVMKVLNAHLAKTKGIICFSDNWRSPVMWAHYANKHYGICLGFDIPDELAGPVIYNPNRLKFELQEDKKLYGIDDAFIETLRYTKAKEWEYEREWRLSAELKARDVNGFYYVDFGPQLRLREIIVGARSGMSIGQVAKLVKMNPEPVLVMKARTAFQEFAMVRNKAVAAITVKTK